MKMSKPELAKAVEAQEKPKLSATPNMHEKRAKTASMRQQSVQAAPGLRRKGMIRLIVAPKDADSHAVFDFENQLRNIPDIRLVMVSGPNKEGVQVTVSSEKSIALSDTLRQLSIVEEITDRPSDILIKLKAPLISERK